MTRSSFSFVRNFFRKPVPTFRDHALAHVPGRKQERAGASLRRAGRGSHHRWKRAPQLSGVNCIVSAAQLAGRQLTPSDRPVDGGLGDTCGLRRTAWRVHSLLMTPKRRPVGSHAVIKDRLSCAAAPRRETRWSGSCLERPVALLLECSGVVIAFGRRGRLANRAGLAFHAALRRVLSRLCRAFRRLVVLCPELLTPAMIGRR
jgi:hypothetical protein